MSALPARLNPFAVERLHGFGYRDPRTGAPADLDRLLARFDAVGRRAAVVGPEGSGKTTLLGALAPRLAERGACVARLRARPDGTVEPLTPLPAGLSGVCLLVDGADGLGRRAWRRLRRAARRADGLLVTSHRPGLLPTLVACAATPRLLETLVEEVLRSAPRPEDRGALPPAADLLARHRGDVRRSLLELYDLHAER